MPLIGAKDLHFAFKRCGKKSNADSSPKKRAQNDGVGESNRVNLQSSIVNQQSKERGKKEKGCSSTRQHLRDFGPFGRGEIDIN
jgi:hypothetical protein